MVPITIIASKDRFERNGRPFFYLTNTVWSVFTIARTNEWKEYLGYSRQQGFNAL